VIWAVAQRRQMHAMPRQRIGIAARVCGAMRTRLHQQGASTPWPLAMAQSFGPPHNGQRAGLQSDAGIAALVTRR